MENISTYNIEMANLKWINKLQIERKAPRFFLETDSR